jgi:hypothetical protein
MDSVMLQNDDIPDTPRLDCEAWRELLRSVCERYNPQGVEPDASTGWVLGDAARLLHRRASLGTGRPISEIAYACGFRDHRNFARKFRRRFGSSPSAYSEDQASLERFRTTQSALLAHDTRSGGI